MDAPRRFACGCGGAGLELSLPPLLRFYCHCSLCQQFNAAPRADMVVYRRSEVSVLPGSELAFERLRPPPAVDRGRCARCREPVVEFFDLPLAPQIAFVPAGLLEQSMALPGPALHVFCAADEAGDDGLPRYDGYLRSQLAFLRRLLPALVRRPR
jgi:hypothetical protein